MRKKNYSEINGINREDETRLGETKQNKSKTVQKEIEKR